MVAPAAKEARSMRDAVIVEAVRTPVGKGKPNGSLAHVHPVELLAHTLRTLVARSGVDPALIDDVIGGTVDQVGEQAMNTTRYAVLSAGFPESVPATTVDRQCGSSQQAVHFAAQGVLSGAYDLVVACGVESMSRVPMWSNVPPGADPFGPGVAGRYPEGLVPQGISAELIAAKWSLTRERMDAFAVSSHRKAAAAWDGGLFDAEVAPLDGVTRDECVRPDTTPEVLAGLRPPTTTPGSPSASRRSSGTSPRATPARSTTAPPPCSSRPARPRPASGCARSPGCTASPSPDPTRC
ncbi:hypothetical protein GCM10020295_71180 [Streptomyces cinereospinus]